MFQFTKARFLFLFVLAFGFGLDATAQIVTDRPDQTESALTVPAGAFQMESGIASEYAAGIRVISAPNVLLRYGIFKNFELRLFNQILDFKNSFAHIQGIGDLQFGAKLQILNNESSNTKIALLSHLVLPSGSESFRSNYVGTISRLCISHQLTESLGLAYNVGYQYYSTQEGELIYSLSLSKSINNKFSIYLEPFGGLDGFEEVTLALDTGFTYLINPNVQLDFTYGVGATSRFNFFAAGVSWIMTKDK